MQRSDHQVLLYNMNIDNCNLLITKAVAAYNYFNEEIEIEN